MLDFIKENLLWIVVPFVLVVAAVGILLYVTSGDGGADNGFVYNVF